MIAGSAIKAKTATSAVFLLVIASPVTVPVERKWSGGEPHQRNLQNHDEDEQVVANDDLREDRRRRRGENEDRGGPACGADDEGAVAQDAFLEQPPGHPQRKQRL